MHGKQAKSVPTVELRQERKNFLNVFMFAQIAAIQLIEMLQLLK